jgi:hypothetical protein
VLSFAEGGYSWRGAEDQLDPCNKDNKVNISKNIWTALPLLQAWYSGEEAVRYHSSNTVSQIQEELTRLGHRVTSCSEGSEG